MISREVLKKKMEVIQFEIVAEKKVVKDEVCLHYLMGKYDACKELLSMLPAD